MQKPIRYNELVSTPTLLFKNLRLYETVTGREASRDETCDNIMRLCSSSYFLGKEGQEEWWINNIEAFCRHMVASCATKVRMPTLDGGDIPKASALRKGLSDSLRKRLVLSDRTSSLWLAVLKYLEPVREGTEKQNKAFDTLGRVAWGLYLLALASKTKAEVSLSPHSIHHSISILLKNVQLNSEAQSRLSNLAGIFNLYNETNDIPCLRIKPSISGVSVSERIEEIMEDAYLLEASHLRRFIGFQANIASIKKNLRTITKFITKNRKWAKGILATGTEVSYIPSAKIGEKLLDVLSDSTESGYSPICINPSAHLNNLVNQNSDVAVQVTRNLYGYHTYYFFCGTQ